MKGETQTQAEKAANSRQDTKELLRGLPDLATAEQISSILQVSVRQVHLWAQKDLIPTALRKGRVVRFSPTAVFQALGVELNPNNRTP